MNTFKHFKTLPPDALVELLPETEIWNSGATLAVEGLCHNLPPNHYEKLVAENRAASVLLRAGDVPLYRLIWQKISGGTQIWILLAQALRDEISDIRFLGRGIDLLAKDQGVSAVLFSTARKALIEQARTWGATPFQIFLKKEYAW